MWRESLLLTFLVIAVACSAAAADSVDIVLKDHLDHEWTGELV